MLENFWCISQGGFTRLLAIFTDQSKDYIKFNFKIPSFFFNIAKEKF
jgi:hypothetical protein